MPGEQDPDCRRPMIWNKKEQNRDLYDVIRRLSFLKGHEPALASSHFILLQRPHDYIRLERRDKMGGTIVLLINYARNPYRIPQGVDILLSKNDRWMD